MCRQHAVICLIEIFNVSIPSACQTVVNILLDFFLSFISECFGFFFFTLQFGFVNVESILKSLRAKNAFKCNNFHAIYITHKTRLPL